jgi:hypothetical protein
MLCASVDSNGFVKLADALADGTCASLVLIGNTEFALIASAQITAEDILTDFSWGFGTVLFFWFIGYSIGAAKKAVNLT